MAWTAQSLASLRGQLGLSQAELGKRLAPHRDGRYLDQPYSRAFISSAEAGKAAYWSADFMQALDSFVASMRSGQENFRTISIDVEDVMMFMVDGKLSIIGDGKLRGVVGYGEIGDDEAIFIVNNAPKLMTPLTGRCEHCGSVYARRSPRQKYCPDHHKPSSRKEPANAKTSTKEAASDGA